MSLPLTLMCVSWKVCAKQAEQSQPAAPREKVDGDIGVRVRRPQSHVGRCCCNDGRSRLMVVVVGGTALFDGVEFDISARGGCWWIYCNVVRMNRRIMIAGYK